MGATFDLEVSPGHAVSFRELGALEFIGVVEAAGGISPATEMKVALEGIRKSLVSDRGTPVRYYPDLVGDKLAERFTTKEFLTLRQAWSQVHTPDAEDQNRVRAMRAVGS